MKVATAPVTWGVWEATIDRDDLPPADALLATMRDVGYSRLELGPPGYFGAEPEAAARRLRDAGMTLVGAFAPLHLDDAAAFEADQRELTATIATLACFADDDPLVVLADAGSPERIRAAGKPEELRATALRGDALRHAAARLASAAERCRAESLQPCFHHHAESYFEAPEEVDALLAQLAGEPLGLCFDTGHALIGGGDPVELMRAWAPRISHLHLKDVEPGLVARLRAGEVGIEAAWEAGLFCPLGEGSVDFGALFALPEMRAFTGLAVIEQDRVAVTATELADIARVEAANLAFLRDAAAGAGLALR